MNNTQVLANAQAERLAVLQGNTERVAKQHADGKKTARERVDMLLDEGSFAETDTLVSCGSEGSGVVTGYGTIGSRPVCVFAQDYTVKGGAMGVMQAKKICRLLDLAVKTGAPVIALCDSAGVRLDEGAAAMQAYASVYTKMTRMSGICPIIAVVLGPVIGGAAVMTQLADFSVAAENVASLMVYGPQVMNAVAGKSVDAAKLGGAEVLARQGGISLTAADEAGALALAAQLVAMLPANNNEYAPAEDDGDDDLNRMLTVTDAADAASLMTEVSDAGACLELYASFGTEIRTALSRIGGETVGLIVSDAAVNDGLLTAEASTKAARLIRFCDCFGLPVVSLINSRGVAVPAVEKQADTMIASSKLLYAYAEASCPKISVITGNAIGQAYVAMGAGTADLTYAWPDAVISALTPDAAVQVLCEDELKKGEKSRAELEEAYAAETAGALAAAKAGMVDDLIEPAETRKYIIAALEMLAVKDEAPLPRRHGNLPL